MNIRKISTGIASGLAAIALSAGAAGAHPVVSSAAPVEPVSPPPALASDPAWANYPACETDEAEGAGPCYWDASTQGDGLGFSFVVHADDSWEIDWDAVVVVECVTPSGFIFTYGGLAANAPEDCKPGAL